MTPVDVDGVKYLVSVRGETEWVKSVRANPRVKQTTKLRYDRLRCDRNAGRSQETDPGGIQVQGSKATARFFRQLPRRRRPPGVRAHAGLVRKTRQ
jgi:hypothetical protein